VKITVHRNELRAAIIFASNDDTRLVLNGVCIEVGPNRQPLLVACDGRRMVAIETTAEQAEPAESEHSLILETGFVKIIASLSISYGAELFPLVNLEVNPGSAQLKASLVVAKYVGLEVEDGALIQGDYPDWRKVVPAKTAIREPLKDVAVNAEFVGDYAKAAKLLGSEARPVQMNLIAKESPIEVKLHGVPNFYGVIMPVKADEVDDYQPTFLGILDQPKSPTPQVESALEAKIQEKAA
jgi:hypothetical protein